MYSNDYDETLVGAGNRYPHQNSQCFNGNTNYNTNVRAWVDWEIPLLAYTKNEQLFVCPSKREWGCSGYAMNTDSSNDDYPGPGTPPGSFLEAGLPAVQEAAIQTPAECLVYFDSFDENLESDLGTLPNRTPDFTAIGDNQPDTEAWELMGSWLQGVQTGVITEATLLKNFPGGPWRHSGQLNVGWADGHVKSVKFAALQLKNLNIEGAVFNNGWGNAE